MLAEIKIIIWNKMVFRIYSDFIIIHVRLCASAMHGVASTSLTVVNLRMFSLHYYDYCRREREWEWEYSMCRATKKISEIDACSIGHLNAKALDPRNHRTNLEYLMRWEHRSDARRRVVELIPFSIDCPHLGGNTMRIPRPKRALQFERRGNRFRFRFH